MPLGLPGSEVTLPWGTADPGTGLQHQSPQPLNQLPIQTSQLVRLPLVVWQYACQVTMSYMAKMLRR